MQLFQLLLIFIPIPPTACDSDTNDVIKSSDINCPLEPYPPVSLCAAVPEMNRAAYFELATECLHDTYTKAWYLRGGGKPSEGNSKEMNEMDGDTGNDDKPGEEDCKEINEKDGNAGNDDRMVDSHNPCMICLCAHFLNRFSKDQQRTWILQKSWAEATSVSLSHCISHLLRLLSSIPFAS